ncbi:hypothetical protein [Dactylosporangium aurantiacum]|uniref:hypothetical protein n=1 Tax=Dactylosporangium aurantiacum TaxID=35754 RepID=UPI0036F2CC43
MFGTIAAALAAATILYVWWPSGGHGHPEWAGAMTLGLSGGMSLMCAGYCWLVSRHIPAPTRRPTGRRDRRDRRDRRRCGTGRLLRPVRHVTIRHRPVRRGGRGRCRGQSVAAG